MREIRFRAWWKDREGKAEELINDINDRPISDLNQSHLIIEQYTGLKDKNGKEIYEGDIIEMYDEFGRWRAPVVFERGLFGFDVLNVKQISNPADWSLSHDKIKSRSWACTWGYEENGTAFTYRKPLAQDTTFKGRYKDYQGSDRQKLYEKHGYGSHYLGSGEIIGNIHENPELLK